MKPYTATQKPRAGLVNPLSDEFAGFLRLHVRNYRVVFKETTASIAIHRFLDRKDAYR